MAINGVDNPTPVSPADSIPVAGNWSWLKKIPKILRRNKYINQMQPSGIPDGGQAFLDEKPHVVSAPLSTKVESIIKASEIKEGDFARLRGNKAELAILSGSAMLNEMLMGDVSVAFARAMIVRFLKEGTIDTQQYTQLLSAQDIDKSEHFWDKDYDMRAGHPQTKTDAWFVTLFETASKQNENYLQAKAARRDTATQLGEKLIEKRL